MAVSLSPFAGAGWQFFDNNGVILSGGKLYTYAAGTTSSATTYTSVTGSTANTNPIILNSSGRLANEIWLTTGLNYKFILKTSADVLIGTWDNIPAGTTDVADLQAALASSTGAGMIGYIQGGTAVATTVQTKLRETVSVKDFGAKGDGTTDDTAAIQAAIDAVTPYGTVLFPAGNYKVTTTLNCTTTLSKNRCGLSMVAEGGRRGGVTIKCETNNWVVDLSGSAYTYWKGLYFVHGTTNISKGCFFAAGTSDYPECLYNTFDNIYVELYNSSAPIAYGTIGYAIIGSEENTWIGCQVYANSPLILSTAYSTVSTNYPAVYATPQAAHSCGMNTFVGACSFNTYDKKYSNIYLYNANSIKFENMYCGNVNISTAGSNESAVNVLGGTIEGMTGNFKLESKSTFIEASNSEWYNFDLKVAFGAGTSASYSVVSLPTPNTLSINKYQNVNLKVSYYSPTSSEFNNKKVITGAGVSGGTGNQVPQIANWNVFVAQDSGYHGAPFFPAQFCGIANNCTMQFPDCTYTIDKNRHVKRFYQNKYLGTGAGSGDVIAKIYLPSITSGYSARAIGVRVDGLISDINVTTGAGETDVTCCYFNTSKGAYSTNNGTIVVGANGASSDLLKDTTSINMSSNSGLYLYTGITLNMTYYSSGRYIDLIAVPRGSGASLSGILAFINDFQVELVTTGRSQELIYIS